MIYSPWKMMGKYLRYFLHAANGKGHGIHSPFVFDFIIHVLNDRKHYPCYDAIEALRKSLLRDETWIEVKDFGAGSGVFSTNKRLVKKIASSSLKKKKYAQLLFRIAQYFDCHTIVELGTSFGITSLYFSHANKNATVYTLEGADTIADIARKNFAKSDAQNIELLVGDFSSSIPALDKKIESLDLIFIDGNHRKAPTLQYFEHFLRKAHPNSVFIFDDIHWSEEMEEAWKEIQNHESVRLTIDLFFIGIVFFKSEFKVKQHFSIRF